MLSNDYYLYVQKFLGKATVNTCFQKELVLQRPFPSLLTFLYLTMYRTVSNDTQVMTKDVSCFQQLHYLSSQLKQSSLLLKKVTSLLVNFLSLPSSTAQRFKPLYFPPWARGSEIPFDHPHYEYMGKKKCKNQFVLSKMINQ